MSSHAEQPVSGGDAHGKLPPSTNQTLKDGETIKVSPDEAVKVDRGTLKKGETGASKPSEVYTGEQKPETETQQGLFGKGTSSSAEAGGSTSSSFTPDKDFLREVTDNSDGNAIPQKRSEIVKFLQDKLDVPIRTGRFRSKGALGIFKPKDEVIRTKFANDIETISHEIGHGLQKYLWPESVTKQGFTKDPFPNFRNELEPIATKTRAGQPKTTEGFAEFIRMYITNEAKAIKKAPNFYSFFEKTLQEKAPEVREILSQARNDFNRWINQPAMARVLGQISVGENKGPARDIDTLFKEAYTATIDDLFPLRKAVQEMTRGEDLPAISDLYKLARLIRGWWGKAESFLEYKPFDYNNYESKGKSLKEILSPVKDNLDEFRAL